MFLGVSTTGSVLTGIGLLLLHENKQTEQRIRIE
jgi:hypothetical protein